MKNKIARILATWFGSGLAPKAPGTFGSLAAVPFALFISYYGNAMMLLIASLLVFIIGWWAAAVYEKLSATKDPSAVVIDEVTGVWLAFIPAGLDPVSLIIGFIAFRVFDIAKPWPVSYADKSLSGGLGIMLDDVFAGLMAAGVVVAYQWGMGL